MAYVGATRYVNKQTYTHLERSKVTDKGGMLARVNEREKAKEQQQKDLSPDDNVDKSHDKQVEQSRDTNKDSICDMKYCLPCLETDGFKVESFMFCATCGDTLCKRCHVLHGRNKLIKDHETVPINNVSYVQFMASRLEIDEHCPMHPTEAFEILCITHQELCCKTCRTSTHKTCKEFLALEESAQLFVSRIKNTSDDDHIDCFISRILEIQSMQLDASNKLDETKENVLKVAAERCSSLKQSIDKLHKKTVRDVEKKYQNQVNMHRTSLCSLQKLVDCLQKEKELKHMIPYLPPRKVLLCMKPVESDLKHFYKIMKDDLSKCLTIGINEDKQFNQLLDSKTRLGDVTEQTPTYLPDMTNLYSDLKVKLNSSAIQYMPQVNVATQEQSTCIPKNIKCNVFVNNVVITRVIFCSELNLGDVDFSDGKFLSNGYIVLTDYNNSRLVVLDENFNVFDTFSVLPKQPLGIHVVEQCQNGIFNAHIYVVLDGAVQKFTYNWQGFRKTSIKVSSNDAYGVSVSGATVITCGREKTVFSKIGEKPLKIIEADNENTDPYVAVSPNGEHFYHPDANKIVCRNKYGTKINEYAHSELKCPVGICTDKQGNVYVVCMESCNIHQMSADFLSHRILVDHIENIDFVYGIAFHPKKNMFIVTSMDEKVAIQAYSFVDDEEVCKDTKIEVD